MTGFLGKRSNQTELIKGSIKEGMIEIALKAPNKKN